MSRGQGRVYRPKVKRPDGSRQETQVWWLDYGVNGQQHRESSGTERKTEALDLLRERIGHRKEGKIIGRPERVTVHDLRIGLERHYEREANRSLKRAKQGFAHLEAFLRSTTPALKVTKRGIGEYFSARAEEGAARGTIRYEIALLNAAYSVAVEDELLAVRPMFKLPKGGEARTGFFDDGDFAALLIELPQYVRPVIRFARLTGWRKSEVLSLTWERIDSEGQLIRLNATETKGECARAFPFGPATELKELLVARWTERDGLYVFHRNGKRIADFRKVWAWACKKAGLEGRRVHDLRRTAARDYRRAGVSEGEIMKLCGWKTRACSTVTTSLTRRTEPKQWQSGSRAANKRQTRRVPQQQGRV